MHYKFVYENNRGQRINLSEHPYYLDIEPLLDYQWSYSQKEKRRGNIIAGFAKDIQSMDLTLNILARETSRRDEAIDAFNNLIEADIYDGIAGKIWLNDWYTRGYIISSQNTKWQYGKPIVQKKVKLVREQENWYHSVRVGNFGNTEQEEAFNFLEDDIKTFERVEGASTNDFRTLSVDINPKQSGSGEPSPDNVRPISGWDEARATRSGKNLLDSSYGFTSRTLNGVTFTVNEDKSVTINGTATDNTYFNYTFNGAVNTSKPMPQLACKTVTIRCLNANENVVFVPNFFREDGTYGGMGSYLNSEATTRTIPSDFYSFRAYIYVHSGKTVSNLTVYPQIELGSTATSYEPYQADTYTTDLPETVYGGTLDVVNGVLTVDKAMVDLGTLNWGYNSSYEFFYGKINSLKENGNLLCSAYNFVGAKSNEAMANVVNGSIATSITKYAKIKNTAYTNTTLFKTAMNGVQLVYELAEPRTIKLAPKQVTTLLGTNNVWADSGEVTVEYWDDAGRIKTASGSVVTFSKRNVMSGTGYDYAYDYMADIQSQQRISNPNSTPCEFIISIQGYVNRPVVQIGENVIAVDVEVPHGANLQVDSSAKTATLTLADGTMINVFGARDPDYYLFARIPSGNNIVTWNGSFMWEIKMLEERSEPRWLTD